MDLVVTCPRLPQPGETLHGDSIQELPGGKGANQAVAAARLGAEVSLVGRVGDDAFGARLIESLKRENVSVGSVKETASCSSGVAVVAVESSGENAITIIAGANGLVSPEDVRQASNVIESASMLLIQLETPVETALEAIAVARECGTPVLLDPAPVPDAASEVIESGLLKVEYVCPNETETALLTGLPVETDNQAIAAATRLCELGSQCAVITRGQHGALVYHQDGRHELIASPKIEAVDSTAAGDAFAAAFAVQLSTGASSFDAARYACQAGAKAASRLGAQSALPTCEDIRL